MSEVPALIRAPAPVPAAAAAQPSRAPSALTLLRRSPQAWLGSAGLVGVAAFTYLGPLIYRGSPYATHLAAMLQPPSRAFPLGTDSLGRDELARLMLGGQVSLEIGLAAALVAVLFGVLYGLAAGYFGRALDAFLMRLVDLLRSIPPLFLLLFLDAIISPSPGLLVVLIAGISWHGVSRLVRAETLHLKELAYIEAARAMGASRWRVALRHILPGTFHVVGTTTTFLVADAILTVSGLSFLGLGLPPPAPNWGGMLADSMSYMPQNAWWLVYPPGILLTLTLVCLNLLGDALRAVFNPRLRRSSRPVA